MGMSMGMMGALGGVGAGFMNEADLMAKDETANKDAQRKKDFQTWLMQAQDQYSIKSEDRAEQRDIRKEGRADTRTEEQKNRDFTRLQAEAPVRTDLEAKKKSADVGAEIDAKGQRIDALQNISRAEAVGKETEGDLAVKKAHASYYGMLGDAATSKTNDLESKLSPADAAALKDIQGRLKAKEAVIDKGMAEMGWNPEKNPGQAQLKKEAAVLRQQQTDILNRYGKPSGGGQGGGADPLNLGARAAPASTRVMTSPRSAEPAAEPGMVGNFLGSREKATALIDDIKDPQERANARAAADQFYGGGAAAPPPPKPTSSAAPTDESELARLQADPAMRDEFNQENRDINSMKRSGYSPEVTDWRGKIERLRSQLRDRKSQEYKQSQFERDRDRARRPAF